VCGGVVLRREKEGKRKNENRTKRKSDIRFGTKTLNKKDDLL
jgi:hypothetical protein